MKYLILILSSLFLCENSLAASAETPTEDAADGRKSPVARTVDEEESDTTTKSEGLIGKRDIAELLADSMLYAQELNEGNSTNLKEAKERAKFLCDFDGNGGTMALVKGVGEQLQIAIKEFEEKSMAAIVT